MHGGVVCGGLVTVATAGADSPHERSTRWQQRAVFPSQSTMEGSGSVWRDQGPYILDQHPYSWDALWTQPRCFSSGRCKDSVALKYLHIVEGEKKESCNSFYWGYSWKFALGIPRLSCKNGSTCLIQCYDFKNVFCYGNMMLRANNKAYLFSLIFD